MKTVTVDADALRQVLTALNGPAYLIRELQATRVMPEALAVELNPINRLVADYNAAVVSHQAKDQPRRPIAWLLIGGPMHGKALWIKAGQKVKIFGEDGCSYEYRGLDYRLDSKHYRVGVLDDAKNLPGDLPSLIKESGVPPMGE